MRKPKYQFNISYSNQPVFTSAVFVWLPWEAPLNCPIYISSLSCWSDSGSSTGVPPTLAPPPNLSNPTTNQLDHREAADRTGSRFPFPAAGWSLSLSLLYICALSQHVTAEPVSWPAGMFSVYRRTPVVSLSPTAAQWVGANWRSFSKKIKALPENIFLFREFQKNHGSDPTAFGTTEAVQQGFH